MTDRDPFATEMQDLGPDEAWPPFEVGPTADRRQGGPQRSRIKATPFEPIDPTKIPRREWLYGHHLIRRFVSLTVAPGAVGKSSLVLVEAIALATGRPLLGIQPIKRCRVWCWNGEDPLEEIQRRVAAICIRYDVPQEDLKGWLFLDSGRTSKIILAETDRNGTKLALPVIDDLKATISEHAIDVVYLDPFVSTHGVSENDNPAVDAVASVLNEIAEETFTAFDLVHHVRKGQGSPGEYTVEDGRGAGALLAKSRSARVLNTMTKDEAERAGVDNHRGFFRTSNGKANLAPPPSGSDWFRFTSVSLGNGPPGLVDLSDHVAVVEPWQWPDPMADMTVTSLRKAQAAIREGRWRADSRSPQWAGNPIAAALGITLDKAGKAKVTAMLKTWTLNRMFVEVRGHDEARRERLFLEVGEAASD